MSLYASPPQDLSTEAADKFTKSLMGDEAPLASGTDTSVVGAIGIAGSGKDNTQLERMMFSGTVNYAPEKSDVQIVPLPRWVGPLRMRRNNQADDLRKRLEDPSAVMLVRFGVTYSERSVWKVFWLYFKTKYLAFPRLKKLFNRS